MPRELNRLMAAELEQRFPKGADYVVVGFAKLSGPETAELRKTLRGGKIRMEVVKNSVAVRALEAGGLGAGAAFVQGPCALVAGEVALPAICKVLVEQSKKLENRIWIRGGVMDGAAVDRAGIAQLASIPPLPVLRAQMAGSLLRADGAPRRRVPEHSPEPGLRSRRHPEAERRDESAARPAGGRFWTRPWRGGRITASLPRACPFGMPISDCRFPNGLERPCIRHSAFGNRTI